MTTTPMLLQITDLPDGVRIDLPRRDLGPARWFGLLPMAFGVFFSGFAVFWMLGAGGWLGGRGPQGWFQWLFMLWGVPFVVVGTIPVLAGLSMMVGHSRIELTGGVLWQREHVGPFRWSWRRPLEGLQRLRVSGGASQVKVNGRPVTSGRLGELYGLAVEYADGKKSPLALGYPKEMLLEAATELSKRIQLARAMTVGVGSDQAVAPLVDTFTGTLAQLQEQEARERRAAGGLIPVVDEDASAGSAEPAVEQPAGSACVLEPRADGVSIVVPPLGLWKGSKGLFQFGLLWCTFVAVIGGLVISKGHFHGTDLLVPLLIFPLFLAIGAGMIWGGAAMGRRRAIFDVVGAGPGPGATLSGDGGGGGGTGGTLLLTMQSLGKPTQKEWPAGQITAIRVGPSGMAVNNKPVPNLHIVEQGGKTHKYLTGRDAAELRWIAYVLRQALGVGT